MDEPRNVGKAEGRWMTESAGWRCLKLIPALERLVMRGFRGGEEPGKDSEPARSRQILPILGGSWTVSSLFWLIFANFGRILSHLALFERVFWILDRSPGSLGPFAGPWVRPKVLAIIRQSIFFKMNLSIWFPGMPWVPCRVVEK